MDKDKIKEDLRKKVPAFTKKVAPLYRWLGWKWAGVGVPSEADIERELYRLIDNVIAQGLKSCATGGLVVGINVADKEAYMAFSVDECVYF